MTEQENNVENVEEQKKQQEFTDEQLETIIKNAEEQLESQRIAAIEKLRKLPIQRVLTPKQNEILLAIKEEELTDDDKKRLAWAKLRFTTNPYTGSDYTPKEMKKIKARRRLAKQSRKANR